VSAGRGDDRDPALLALCRASGVLTEHEDGMGVRRRPSEAALLAILRALGVDIDRASEAASIDRTQPPWLGDPGVGRRFWAPAAGARTLAVFLPLHALVSARSQGVGDLGDLRELGRWAGRAGAGLLGTLPLLAGRHRTPADGCPYAPLSRSVFDELFLDLGEALTPAERGLADRLNASRLVDYAGAWSLKRTVLGRMAAQAAADAEVVARVRAFVEDDPLVGPYAAFRAKEEGDASARWVYEHAQWLLHGQLAAQANGSACGLYLDLPVGVSADSFDVARNPGLYARGVTVGAPPDGYFPEGQDWSFAPIIPQQAHESGHAELEGAVRRHLRYARALRLDHVMGFHRLYWIPEGMGPTEGAYVRYPAGEVLDLLAGLSQEYGALLIGENLGTVPPEVDRAMVERGLLGMVVSQYDAGASAAWPPPGKPIAIATPNTHDMPTFAGYLRGRDIDLRESLGLLDRWSAGRQRLSRERAVGAMRASLGVGGGSDRDLFEALVRRLCASAAPVVVVSLEDLWGEADPQNLPGVTLAYPCWRRRAARALEGIVGDSATGSALRSWRGLMESSPAGRRAEKEPGDR